MPDKTLKEEIIDMLQSAISDAREADDEQALEDIVDELKDDLDDLEFESDDSEDDGDEESDEDE